jgi:uracil-DNA glycosylase family 4
MGRGLKAVPYTADFGPNYPIGQISLMRDQLIEHLKFAAELGVAGVSKDPAWRTRLQGAADSRQTNADDEPLESEPVMFLTRETLADIKADLGDDCRRCKLHKLGRKQVVFGVGNPDADLMFVGEAPGADEDEQGIPFVGRAGQLLTKIIEAIGLTRDDVYIANVIKCRPPQNRNPEQDEVDTCEPFLFRQIDTIKPKVIVALGTFAARALLRTLDPISRLRGRVYDYRGAKLIPTFHPAYLLRNPASKRDVWEDMKVARGLLQASDSRLQAPGQNG